MIRLGYDKINKMDYADIPINKAYYGDRLVHITYVGYSPYVQKPCFAVTDSIDGYTDRKYEDVYDKSKGKWYKLNNLGEYEEYGIYGKGFDTTTYVGKLTSYEGIEYEWDGSKWAEVGEMVETTILSPKYLIRDASHMGSIDLGVVFDVDSVVETEISGMTSGGGSVLGDGVNNDSDDFRLFRFGNTLYFDYGGSRINISVPSSTWTYAPYNPLKFRMLNYRIEAFYGDDGARIGATDGQKQNIGRSETLKLFPKAIKEQGDTDYGNVYSVKIYSNDGEVLTNDFIPWTDGNGNYGMYDKVEGNIHKAFIGQNASTNISGSSDVTEISTISVPKEYEIRMEPENNIKFDTMEEALSYKCPWIGMEVKIGGAKYKYTEDGWNELIQYFNVDLNNQWQPSTSYGDITDTDNYEFYESFSNYKVDNGIASMVITIDGYDSFTFKVRNDNGTENNYDYVVVNNLDDLSVPKWQPNQGDGLASNGYVYYRSRGTTSPTEWNVVTFNNLDGGEHKIMVSYGKDNMVSNEPDKGYIAIPTEKEEPPYDLLDYVTVPRENASNNTLTVPMTILKGATYEFKFTPLDFEDSYYGTILGGPDTDAQFPMLGIFKLDNGWGDTCRRMVCAIGNYNLENRSPSPIAGQYCINNNVTITITLSVDDEGGHIHVTDSNGQDSTGTSNKIFTDGMTDIFDREFDLALFGKGNSSEGGTVSNINFHRFTVKTKEGKVMYDYAPIYDENEKPIIVDLVSGNQYRLPFIQY